MLEHEPVISIGNKGDVHDILVDPATLERQGVSVVSSDRGGQTTYHGPGQLTTYPVLDLRRTRVQCDIGWYLDALHDAIIEAAAAHGVGKACRMDHGIGVWLPASEREGTPDRKIAAIGAKLSRWVVHHGAALNVCPDLVRFEQIVPCGLSKLLPASSLQAENGTCDVQAVGHSLIGCLASA
eukprot:TRINITY_DN3260_c0_g1_i1.p1 TRINITY_DN3260_c0_g1~~TRINITY_DN3260_c0_g1_i1.p1  ORF type:complete len:182 (-),score=26.61 TRINITY_DN3260_c0_g1_i1:373-918(-)